MQLLHMATIYQRRRLDASIHDQIRVDGKQYNDRTSSSQTLPMCLYDVM